MIRKVRRKPPCYSENDDSKLSIGMAVTIVVDSNGDEASMEAPGVVTMVNGGANDETSGSPSLLLPGSCNSGRCNLPDPLPETEGPSPKNEEGNATSAAEVHDQVNDLGSGKNTGGSKDFCCWCTVCPSAGRVPSNDTRYGGEDRFQLRGLSDAEGYHLQRAMTDQFLQKASKYFGPISCLFEDHLVRLKQWPKFFKTTDESGHELQDGFVTMWTTFIIAESLLASVAIQPFITNGGNLTGWQLEVYGLVWMLALLFEIFGFAVTAVFLGFLHGVPKKLTYMWLCGIGAWVGVPSLLVLLGCFMSVIAIAYSSWVIYGQRLGIACIVIEVLIVIFALAAKTHLDRSADTVATLK